MSPRTTSLYSYIFSGTQGLYLFKVFSSCTWGVSGVTSFITIDEQLQ